MNGPHNMKIQRSLGVRGYPTLVLLINGKPELYPNSPFKKSRMRIKPIMKFLKKKFKEFKRK